MEVDNLVLGAGISGLACANEITENGRKCVIFEAEKYAGGLCHSFKINDFCFDSAVHLSFTENKEARKFFDKTSYQAHPPISFNFYNSLWIKHPLINNMYLMSPEEKTQCIKSFIERKKPEEILNYKEWLRASYGDVIAEKFYEVYTKKYWTVDAEMLSTSWVGRRLNSPDLEKMLMGSFSEETGNDYYTKEMRYPMGNGGYETFLEPLKGADIRLEKKAVQLDLENKIIFFGDGTSCHYGHLYSSIPLPELVNLTKNVPMIIKQSADKLKATKISLVSVGFHNPHIVDWLWFYIYDQDILSARVNCPSNKSSRNVPVGYSSLQFEIYHYPDDQIDEAKVLENVRYALKKMKLGKEDEIVFMEHSVLPYGNVIYTLDMEKNRAIVKEYYEKMGVKLIGRFGEWEYYWSDQSYLSGVSAGRI